LNKQIIIISKNEDTLYTSLAMGNPSPHYELL
jgi:hypothetical protein